MGLEARVQGKFGRKSYTGKLYLDSKELRFSHPEWKWKIELSSSTTVNQRGQWLHVIDGKQKAAFELGDDGPKWSQKILNPPTRIDKLGVKPTMHCWLSTGFDRSFRQELKSVGATVVRDVGKCDLGFFLCKDASQLESLADICHSIPKGKNLWVVWPKGSDAISQGDVMAATKRLGWGPSKTAAFADGWSSMRYAHRATKK